MSGGGGGDNEFEVNINLTALLDVLTNLLFFLMFGFASSRAAMEIDDGVKLPSGKATMEPKKAVMVSIAREELRVEKETVVALRDGRVVGVTPGARIEPLFRKLTNLKQQQGGENVESADVLVVLCDKETPYALLKNVLMTGAEAGYPKFRLTVLTE